MINLEGDFSLAMGVVCISMECSWWGGEVEVGFS